MCSQTVKGETVSFFNNIGSPPVINILVRFHPVFVELIHQMKPNSKYSWKDSSHCLILQTVLPVCMATEGPVFPPHQNRWAHLPAKAKRVSVNLGHPLCARDAGTFFLNHSSNNLPHVFKISLVLFSWQR